MGLSIIGLRMEESSDGRAGVERVRLRSSALRVRYETKHLLGAVQLADLQNEILRIATEMANVEFIYQRKPAYDDLVKMDSGIPGLGLHNVNEIQEGGWGTGIYRIEDRPIFRGIQYVEAHLGNFELEWLARSIVTESCYHVEGSLKRRLDVSGHLSIGRILGRANARSLGDNLLSTLQYLNKYVYNNAKHTIEHMDWDEHMFSVADALAIYLVCRVLGAQILKGSGITTKHGTLVFDDSSSLVCDP